MTQVSRGILLGCLMARCFLDLPQRTEILKLVMTVLVFLLLKTPFDPTFFPFFPSHIPNQTI